MMKKKVQDALNAQINEELYSAYIYFAMAAYFKSLNLDGFAHWMEIQTQEELSHAFKFYGYMNDRGGRPVMAAISKPPLEWDSPLAAFQEAYKHEQHISAAINKLVDLSIQESDHAMNNMLQWFVAEQVEEEASADEIVKKLKLIGDNGTGVLMIDQELAARVFTPPATVGGA
ncbi:MAG: ferritin [candidate division Zixibacteria bacterium]|nr:ferritin [candidate division Zixibacteria bacterium]MBU1469289.1 ferritin [candidate division Zixibacteria bacterium]MBU2626515.1 ferritin [candidate division Zixibacteria bacterium]